MTTQTNQFYSQKQIELYEKLCAERGITKDTPFVNLETGEVVHVMIDNPFRLTKRELGEQIDSLMAIQTAHPNTQALIESLWNELLAHGTFKQPIDRTWLLQLSKDLANVTIEKLKSMKTEYGVTDNEEPNEYQLERLSALQFVIDVDFEQFGIKRKVELEESSTTHTTDSYYNDKLIKHQIITEVTYKQGMWRWLTVEEFTEELRTKMSRSQASKLLDQSLAYEKEHRDNRITMGLAREIRRLEGRIANIYQPKVVTPTVDIYGGRMDFTSVLADKQGVWTSYNPLTDDEMRMFTRKTASRYIQILKGEMARLNVEEEIDYDKKLMLAEGHGLTEEEAIQEHIRSVTTRYKALMNDFNALNTVVFRVEEKVNFRINSLNMLKLEFDAIEKSTNTEKDVEAMNERYEAYAKEFTTVLRGLISEELIDIVTLSYIMREHPVAIKMLFAS